MGGKAVIQTTSAVLAATVVLAALIGLLVGSQNSAQAATLPALSDANSQGAVAYSILREAVAAPVAQRPSALLRSGSGGPSVITVCHTTCPYNSVQAAVSDVAPGGIVKVAEGVYTGTGDYVVSITKTVTLLGGYTVNDWHIPNPDGHPTVLDGENARTVVHIAAGVSPVVEGFHVRNGKDTTGGGFYIEGGSPTVRRNRIYDNFAGESGGGIYILDGSPTVENNLIYSNTAGTLKGGGIYVGGGTPIIRYDTLYRNTASQGGGVYVDFGSPVITSSIIVENTANNPNGGGGIYNSSADFNRDESGFNDVYNNTNGDYVGVGGVLPNDIQEDPLFLDPSNGDFRLQADSPCVDGASGAYVEYDYDGYARPFGLVADIGAHEFYTGTCFVRVNASHVYTTVQMAVDDAGSGDTVKVAGICVGVMQRNSTSQTVYIDRSLVLRGGYTITNWSEYDPVAFPTVLDAQGQGRVIYINNGRSVVIEGFHIRNGKSGSGKRGGGIYVPVGGDVTITDNWIYDNDSGDQGGGIYLISDDSFITSNELYSNTSTGNGGGMFVGGSNVAVEDNVVHHNECQGYQCRGGGIHLVGQAVVRGNQVYSDAAYYGGGIGVENPADVTVTNNDIFSNTATDGGGFHLVSGIARFGNNIVRGNHATGNGGGLHVKERTFVFDNVISYNEADGDGGGIFSNFWTDYALTVTKNIISYNSSHGNGGGGGMNLTAGGTASIFVSNNLIYNNTAKYGGGARLHIGGNPTNILIAENNTVYDNDATVSAGGGGLYLYVENTDLITVTGNIVVSNTNTGIVANTPVSVTHCDAWNNTQADYGANILIDASDISADPVFVDAPNHDFHLQAGSPCRDAGNPDRYAPDDYAGYARPFGAAPDIGAYEFYSGSCFVRLGTGGQVYTNVQAAVNVAPAGGEVLVAGVCTGTTIITKSLYLHGGYQPTDWETPVTYTVLNGNGTGRVLEIATTDAVTIGEFIVENGSTSGDGGGIYLSSAGSPLIRNIVFYNNNSAQNGGGFAAVGGSPFLYNNTFVENTATNNGGGLYFAAGTPTISNTIVVSNNATNGGGIYGPSAVSLAYNDVWNNNLDDYAGGVTKGPGDISEPPYLVDYTNGDFRLRPGSPCIDVADPHTNLGLDFEGDGRPIGSGYDIGADEAGEHLGVDFGPYLYDYGFPGQVLTYTHYLVNDGTLPDVYRITHTLVVSGAGDGWEIGYTSVYTLDPGVSVAVPMTIRIAGNAVSGTLATVYLTATSDASAYFTAVASNTTGINRSWGAILSPAYHRVVDPGTVLTYVHTLTNTGNAPDTFDITFGSTPDEEQWIQVTPDQVSLPSGGSTQVYVRVDVPHTAAGGVVETVAITATSQGSPPNKPASASISDTTEINYSAGDRYVSSVGTDSLNNCLVITSPCRTVGQAVDQAVSGDLIKVAQGTYNEHDLNLNKSITLRGGYNDDFTANDPEAYQTVIDAGRQGRIFYILGNPTVEGFTLQNGYAAASGGGIYIGLSTPTLRNNVIKDNEAFLRGGGIYNSGGSPVIEQNTFVNNLAGTDGGGLYNNGGSPDVWSNIFYDNQADNGGGIYSYNGSPALLHNTLYANTADGGDGGGLYLSGGFPDVRNNIIVNNVADSGGGIYGNAGVRDYNDVYDNTGGDYDGGASAGVHDMAQDPAFVDAANADFHLLKTSPCIDQGAQTAVQYDVDGQPRWMGTDPDLGADEYQEAGVALSPTAISHSGGPGAWVHYYHVLTNTGNYTDTFALTWNDAHGWVVRVNDHTVQPVTVTLGSPDQNAVVTTTIIHVAIQIPSGVPSGTVDTLWITATSLLDGDVYSTAVDTTSVLRAVSVIFEPDRIGWAPTTFPHNFVVYTHTLRNGGNYTDTFELSQWTSHAAGHYWSVSIYPTPTVVLGGGMETIVYVTVTIPSVANETEVETTIITATSQTDPTRYDFVTDQTVADWKFGIQFVPDHSDKSTLGTERYYTHILTNTGNYTDTFAITYTSSLGWPVTVSPGSTIVMGQGSTTTVQVTVTVPILGGAYGGDVNVTTITAGSIYSPTNRATVTDTIEITRTSGVELRSDQSVAVSTRGGSETVVFVHTLRNRGNATDTFTVSLGSTQGWQLVYSPTVPIQLGPGASANIYITVTVPTNTVNCPDPAVVDTISVTATSQFYTGTVGINHDTIVVNQCRGVDIAPDQTIGYPPGTAIYTHTITNTGNYTDSFVLNGSTLLAAQGWTATPVPGAVNNLGPGMTATVWLRVGVPFVPCGSTGVSTITVSPVQSPTISASAVDTTTVDGVYLVAMSSEQVYYTTSDPSSQVVVTYVRTVTNTGNCTNTFNLLVQGSPEFTTTLSPSTISNLPMNGSASFTVTVTVPPTVTGNLLVNTVLITATGTNGGETTVTDKVVVNKRVDLELAPDGNGYLDHPLGGVVQYTHVLTNTGNYEDEFEVTWYNEDGWPVSVDGNDQQPYVVSLSAGATKTLQVEVTVAADTYTATNHTWITATSRTPSVGTFVVNSSASVTDTTTVRRPHVSIEPDWDFQASKPGITVTLVHTLTNDGGKSDSYTITYRSEHPSWVKSVVPTQVLSLSPGVTQFVTLTLYIPSNTLRDTVDTTVITAAAYTSPSVVLDIATDRTTVPYLPGADLAPEWSGNADPGATVTYIHTLTNTGNYTDTFYLSVHGLFSPVEIEPSTVPDLPPGGSVPVTVTISIPPEAAAGDVEEAEIIVTYVNYRNGQYEEVERAYDTVTINYITGTRYVASTGHDENNNCTLLDVGPCATIQHAVDQASHGDTIKVVAGTYTSSDDQVILVDKSVTLVGGYLTTDWDNSDPDGRPTILDGENARRVIYISSGVTPTIEGFEVRNGYVDNGPGAGFYIADGAAPTVRLTLIYGNAAPGINGVGGGVYYDGTGSPFFERVAIYNNSANRGAGLYLSSGSLRLWNSLIYKNDAGSSGGGLYTNGGTPQIWNDTFYSNTATAGGGIYANGGTLVVSNTIVAENNANGIHVVGGFDPVLEYNDVWGNGSGSSDDYVGSAAPDTGSFSQDPLMNDPAGGDFHLTENSPCINAGAPGVTEPHDDYDGSPRPLAGRHDIGAYEYPLAAKKYVVAAADPGDVITYTIVVTNVVDTVHTVPVTDTLHRYLDYVSGPTCDEGICTYFTATRMISWVVAVNSSNSPVSLTFSARITDQVAAGTPITNVAWVNRGSIEVVTTTVNAIPGVRYVAPTGDDYDNNCLVATRPCATVQWAVDQALDGETVLVATGTYTGVGQVAQIGKNLTLRGGYTFTTWTYDPEIYTTTLSAPVGGNGVVISNAAVSLAGFHITGGDNGIVVNGASASATVSRTLIYGTGDGIHTTGGSLTVERTWIYGNSGDGVEAADTAYRLVNVVIVQNDGAGLRTSNSDGAVLHNTIADNSTGAVIGSQAVFTNTIIYSHTVGLDVTAGSTATVWNTLWWNNGTDWQGSIVSHTNVFGNPSFVDPASVNYHIQGDSAAIDQGIEAGVTEDIDGGPRPVLASPDIGADEYPLSLIKRGPTFATPDEVITYSLKVEAREASVTVSDTLPIYVEYVGPVTCTSGTCGYDPATRMITWTGPLYGAAYITYTGQITSWLAAGTVITNAAWVQGSGMAIESAATSLTISPVLGTRYVAVDGYDVISGTGNNCLNTWQPCATVQWAVDQAQAGDTVKVAPGTYTDTLGAGQVVNVDKAITLLGGCDSGGTWLCDPANPTYLDGENGGRVLVINGAAVTVEGFHILNGDAGGSNNGGGVYVVNADVVLSNNQIYNNTAGTDGGGLSIESSTATIVGSRIYENGAPDDGGGLYVYLSDLTMEGTYVTSNTVGSASQNTGGGMFFYGSNSLTMTNDIVFGNNAGQGDGLYLDAGATNGTATLRHNTIADNDQIGIQVGNFTVAMSDTIVAGHSNVGVYAYLSNADVTADHTLWNGNGQDTSTAAGGTIVTTNDVSGDPDFTADYHIGPNSAALDAGADVGVDVDIDGDSRPMGNGYDIGADEIPVSLAVVKTVTPALVETGLAPAPLTYTIRVTNTGILTLTARITDTLPVSVTPAGPLTWAPTINPGDTWQQTVNVTVAMGYAGTLTNVVEVNTDEGARGVYTVTSEAKVTTLAVSKEAGPALLNAGEQITYTLRVTNTGSVQLHALITDTLPAHVTPAGPLTWSPTLDPGDVWGTVFTVTVDSDFTTGGDLTNIVEVATTEGATGSDSAMVTVLGGGVELSDGYAQVTVPGGVVTFTHRVTNTTNVTQTVTLTYTSGPYGWATLVTPLSPVQLASGDWTTVVVRVDVPLSAGDNMVESTVITATGSLRGEASVTDQTAVGLTGGVEISAGENRNAAPGEVVIYTHRVTNTSNVAQAVDITIDSTQGWATVTPQTTPVLDAEGGWTVVTVTVTVADTANDGDVDTTTITATGRMTGTSSAADTTTVRITGGVELSAGESRNVLPGDEVVYTHRVTNTANIAQDVSIAFDSSQGWATVSPASIAGMAPGASAEVRVTVTVPSNAANGAQETTVITATGSRAGSDTATDRTTVQITGGVELSDGETRTVEAGDVVTYVHRVTNTANIAQDVSIAFSSSQGWAAVSPASIAGMAPGASAEVRVTVTVPSDAANGAQETTVITATGQYAGQDTAQDSTVVGGVTGGVEISAGAAQEANPGAEVVYTHRVTNTSNVAQTVSVAAVSSQGWTVAVAPDSVSLDANGGWAMVRVTVTVPSDASDGAVDVTTVTAQGAVTGTATAQDTTTVAVGCTAITGADFTFSPAEPQVGDTVTFNGTVSAGTSPITYTWAFGDGETGSGQQVTHSYTDEGSYAVTMTATNSCSTETAQHLVVVSSGGFNLYLPLLMRNF